MIIGAIFLQNSNQVWLKNVYVSYTLLYDLEFDVFPDANTTIIHHFKYKFFPQDSIIENGQIVYSGDTTFNGLDMSQLLIGTLPEAVAQAVVGQAPSGDDEGSGLLGGILTGIKHLFVPSAEDITDFIDDRKVYIENNSGFFLKPSVAFVSILNKMYESGDFVIEIPTISIPGSFVFANSQNSHDLTIFDSTSNVNSINFTSLVEDEPWSTLYSKYLVLISGVFVVLFFSYVWSFFDHILQSKDLDHSIYNITRRL